MQPTLPQKPCWLAGLWPWSAPNKLPAMIPDIVGPSALLIGHPVIYDGHVDTVRWHVNVNEDRPGAGTWQRVAPAPCPGHSAIVAGT